MITVDEWAEIRRLHRSEHLPIKAIARKLGISKNTVRRALRAGEVPRYRRAPAGSIADAVEPLVREQLALCATMPATVIAERIGWERSITVLRERVAQLRPLYLPADPAGRTEYEPGHRVQDDFWFPPARIPVGQGKVAVGKEVPPVLVMASGYSRWMLGLMIPSRHAEDLVLGTWRLLGQLGGVPRQLVWDNEGGVGKYRGGGRPPALSRQFAGFRGLLGQRRRTSTPSWLSGRRWRTPGSSRCRGARPRTGSRRTGPRWRRCRRSASSRSAGITGSGCPAITTCASIPATTRWTRR